ncbi:MAG: hypothetical protein ACXAE3_14480 [Candidatus Kariarchaeaceae archaeon]|jgi:hypothetical protein
MKLYACYLIGADGRPLIWQVFQSPDHLPEGGLLAPLLTSIQGVSMDLVKQEGSAEKMVLAGITYHMQWMDTFFVVLVTDTEEKPNKVLNQVGRQFLQKYHDKIVMWNGDVNTFKDFVSPLLTILEKNFEMDTSQSIIPTKQLDTISLFNLEKDLKETALAIFSLTSATPEEVAKESGEPLDNVKVNLEKLKEMGYVGFKVIDSRPTFFL